MLRNKKQNKLRHLEKMFNNDDFNSVFFVNRAAGLGLERLNR